MIGLKDGKLRAYAGHVAFADEPLVAMNGKDVAGWGWKFHGQMSSEDDSAKSVE